ncbi:MAG: ATP-binding cassette domain-containing protein [Bacteroidia bacterium]|nr:ATP-binding cassette domain-containing protein [Bacteroidia bacterium]
MIETRELRFAYPDGPQFQFPDLACAAGNALLILGESGAGKTTLLHLMGGLLRPASGQVRIGGQDLGALSGPKLDRFRGRSVGLVFQRPHLIDALPVAENLRLARSLAQLPPDEDWLVQVTDLLGLAGLLRRHPARLSLGEQQRVGIARALLCRPQVILADEPTSSLDDRNCTAVASLLERAAADAGAALVTVTHDQRLKSRFPQQYVLIS